MLNYQFFLLWGALLAGIIAFNLLNKEYDFAKALFFSWLTGAVIYILYLLFGSGKMIDLTAEFFWTSAPFLALIFGFVIISASIEYTAGKDKKLLYQIGLGIASLVVAMVYYAFMFGGTK